MKKIIKIPTPNSKNIEIGNHGELVIIAGPCAIESYDHSMKMADLMAKYVTNTKPSGFLRPVMTRIAGHLQIVFTDLGLEEGLRVLERVRTETGLPVTSDFSDPAWGPATGEVCDMVQVPAYLCRQTSILRAAAATGKPVHLKKGQFMSPEHEKFMSQT